MYRQETWLDDDHRGMLDQLMMVTGKNQSQIVREAIEMLWSSYVAEIAEMIHAKAPSCDHAGRVE